jgi:hypothetical protein
MLQYAATLIAQGDSRPPFWWIGLFSSPGGLLIVGAVIVVITLIVAVPFISRRRR